MRPLPGVQIWEKCNPYKSVLHQKNEALLLIRTLPCLKFLYQFTSVYLTSDHEKQIQQTKVRCTLKSLAKIVSKRSHQEECVQGVKTAQCVSPCVASEPLQVTDKLPSFTSKAELECTWGAINRNRSMALQRVKAWGGQKTRLKICWLTNYVHFRAFSYELDKIDGTRLRLAMLNIKKVKTEFVSAWIQRRKWRWKWRTSTLRDRLLR